MAVDQNLQIVQWPREPGSVAHSYGSGEPVPVSVDFWKDPLRVGLGNQTDRPLAINLAALVSARGAIPLCLSLCSAICVNSDYTIGVTLFDKPLLSIRIRGTTRLARET